MGLLVVVASKVALSDLWVIDGMARAVLLVTVAVVFMVATPLLHWRRPAVA